jgi:predicted O-methyltransferase YrrM
MKIVTMTPELHEYIQSHNPLPHPILDELAAETRQLEGAVMQIPREQGSLLHLLVRTVKASRVLEVGCYTGYSTICLASALPPDGKVVTLDIDPVATKMAQKYWGLANLADKIDLRLGPADATLKELRKQGGDGSFDFAFIDADKINMLSYYENAIHLVRKGGLIALDNVIWSGKVAQKNVTDADTNAIRAVNDRVYQDPRVAVSLMNVADGVTLALKL